MEGQAEFRARRLEEYQRTLRVMYGLVTESTQENQLTQDLEHLMQVIDSRLQSLATLNRNPTCLLLLNIAGIK